MAINVTCEEHKISQGLVEVGCDNIEALRYAVNLDKLITLYHMHFDFTKAICTQVKASSVEWKASHVCTHQGSNPFQELEQ